MSTLVGSTDASPTTPLTLDPSLEVFHHSWAALLALGISMSVLGILAFIASFATTMVSMFLLGAVMLVAAAMQFAYTVMGRGWRGFTLHLLLAVLYALTGFMFMVQPVLAAESLTMFLGFFLMISGISRGVGAYHLRERHESWAWAAAGGAVSFLLGGLIVIAWPVTSLFVIGAMIGVDLIFFGSYLTMFALSVKKEAKPMRPKLVHPIYS